MFNRITNAHVRYSVARIVPNRVLCAIWCLPKNILFRVISRWRKSVYRSNFVLRIRYRTKIYWTKLSGGERVKVPYLQFYVGSQHRQALNLSYANRQKRKTFNGPSPRS